jgi:hypothetical protein
MLFVFVWFVPFLFTDMYNPAETFSIFTLNVLEIRAHRAIEIHANLTESEFKTPSIFGPFSFDIGMCMPMWSYNKVHDAVEWYNPLEYLIKR